MDLAPVVERLQALAEFRQVGGAAELAAAGENLRATPAAFVLLLAERGAPNRWLGAISQDVAVRFGVLIALKNVRDGTGEAAAADLELLRAAVREAIVGWAPVEGRLPIEFRAGDLVRFEASTLWWQDQYETDYELRVIS